MAGLPRVLVVAAAASLLVCSSCIENGLPTSVMDQVREAQARWLTVDACLYLPEGSFGTGNQTSDASGRSGEKSLWPGFWKMQEAGVDAVVLMISVPRSSPTPEGYARAKEAALRSIAAVRRMIADHGDIIGLALVPPDAYRLKREGKLAVFLGLGDGYALGRDVSLVGLFHGLGVRIIDLCGSGANEICGHEAGAGDPAGLCLSTFGREVVAACNDAGLVMDLTGCPDRALREILATSEAPIVVSEPASAPAGGAAPALDDKTILEVAAKGGLVNVLLASWKPDHSFSRSRPRPPAAEDIANRIDRLIRLVHSDRVGIGSGSGRPGVAGGLEAPVRAIWLTVELLKRGYSEYDLERAWGGNLMKVFIQAQIVADERRDKP